jgi:hypothetical protein
MERPIEFICEDCKTHVFSYSADPEATRCYMCNHVRSMKLPLERETALRKVLGCELEGEEDSAKLGK